MKTQIAKIVTTKSGSINKSIINMLRNCHFVGNKVYTGYYSGSGRFTSAHSAMHTVKLILDAGGYKYTNGNDAKFGGIKGEHVVCSKIAINTLLEIKNAK
jgi:hypothetical protein